MIESNLYFGEGIIPRSGDIPELAPIEQLRLLLNQSAFWAKGRSVEDLMVAIANSCPVLSVWDGGQLIGFARATSDGVFRATIWDVVIHPNYRGIGLGRQLLERLLEHPRMCNVERTYLMTTYQQEFYAKMGFTTNSSTTMVRNLSPAALHSQQVQELESSLKV